MTYYKYAERDATSRVNWSDVSKKWTDEINQIASDRDKKRTEIQTATDELSDKLLNAPMGENKGINSFTANLSEMSTQYLLDANRKLKSGDIKPRDYMELMSNLKQGTSALYDTAKKYSDVYGEKMERLRNGDSQPMEAFLMANAEAMGNFTESNPIINPSNGMLSVYDSTGRTMSVPRMNAAIVSQYDYYDYETEMAQRADQLGKVINVIMEDDVKTLEQARQMEGYTKVEDDYLDAALEDGLHVSSLLTVDMPGYNLSDDASKAGDNDVLLVLHPRQPSTGIMVPLYDFVDDIAAMESSQQEAKLDEIFGADLSNEERANLLRIAGEQKKEAREFLRRDLRSRQADIETPQAEFADTGGSGRGPTDAQIKRQGVIDRTTNAAQHWMNLAFAPTPEQKATSAGALQGTNFVDEYGSRQTIVGVDPLTFEDRVVLTLRDADGNETTVDRVYADSPAAEQWVSQGNFFYEDPSVAEALVTSAQRREEGPLYGGMTLGVRASGAALAKEVVDIIPYEQATIGTGKSAASVPVYFSENAKPGNAESEAAATTSAVKAALGAMGVDASSVTHITEAASEDAGVDLDWDTEKETIRFHIPGITPKSIFVPNNQAGINALADMMAMLPNLIKNRGQLTVEEALKMFSSVPKFKDYNGEKFGDTMREKFGITEAARPTSAGGSAPRPPAPRPGG